MQIGLIGFPPLTDAHTLKNYVLLAPCYVKNGTCAWGHKCLIMPTKLGGAH